MSVVEKRERASHIWAREKHEHYVEEPWVSKRLFDVEPFKGRIFDPCCGFGHIVESATTGGYSAHGCDLVHRGFRHHVFLQDFLHAHLKHDNIVMNPPFDKSREFIEKALSLSRRRVASVYPTRRLNAASWLTKTPLWHIWLLTPRPSMPPGHVYRELEAAGKRPSGGTMDFCWLVFDRHYVGTPTIGWLHRDQHETPAP